MVGIAGWLTLINQVAGQNVTNKPVEPIINEPVSQVTIELVGTIDFKTSCPAKSGIYVL